MAGRRAGLADGTRSGLWHHVARAVEALNPCLVVIENVRGLLTSPAGSRGDLESCSWCLGDAAGQPAVRALGAVLGSLADLRFDARWCVLRASDVGAPHRRERIFLAAWPTGERAAQNAYEQSRDERRKPAPYEAQERGPRPESRGRGRVAAPHPEGDRRDQGIAEAAPWQRDAFAGEPPITRRAAVPVGGGTDAVRRVLPDFARWGPYSTAIARWETLTRPAPLPTDGAGRLSPHFVEWMQGLEPGWVTSTPGLGRPAQLSTLGNGVVPQQAAHALTMLAPPFGTCRHHQAA
ncbi:DNA cytosine methyltransferase [Streptomyces sp. G1]|uniref:DNA cytosine methyltransferase n=1 Tax=Streptomyces sp. G1 TaxID=361572 RepID=UPI00202F1BD1|nr:DNA cytosine methyltransferase [Streptomyces sp. G1]MCM1967976.1 DNA cytosine methyltransferase [Streptomyces sp. G1]